MKNNIYIRKLLGAWLLAIFVLINTPIKVLHYFFADHTDIHTLIIDHNDQAHLQSAGIDCHYDSHVVITPYLYGLPLQVAGYKFFSSDCFLVSNEQFSYTSPVWFEHRGPPAKG